MIQARLPELRVIFKEGKRPEVIAAGEECLAELERLHKQLYQDRVHNFKAPTLAHIMNLAVKVGVTDPEVFYDHHQTYGWKGKKGRIVDFEAALRTWKRNGERFAVATNGSAKVNHFRI
jgi:FMN phosphatase YigB (HAD superfamily)